MTFPRLLAPLAALPLAAALLGCDGSDATTPARFAVTVNVTGMAPHVGQMMELRVVHAETMVEVGYLKVDPITSANFVVSVPDCLYPGEAYNVDFYADLNRNRRYDAPPADHAWRRTLGPVAGNSTLTFTHDVNWTDIEFPPHP